MPPPRSIALPAEGVVDVWHVRLDAIADWPGLRDLLSDAERARADRFLSPKNGDAYTIAHASLRCILGAYLGEAPEHLFFETGEFGKPVLAGHHGAHRVEFNLSHAGELGLIAVARSVAVGVDVEKWVPTVDHLEIARHFFSPWEYDELVAISADRDALVAGFYAVWCRKEAYLKAQGIGIAHGLRHFDVSPSPAEPPRVLADRSMHAAPNELAREMRWSMTTVDVGSGFSAAVVAECPRHSIRLHDANDLQRIAHAG